MATKDEITEITQGVVDAIDKGVNASSAKGWWASLDKAKLVKDVLIIVGLCGLLTVSATQTMRQIPDPADPIVTELKGVRSDIKMLDDNANHRQDELKSIINTAAPAPGPGPKPTPDNPVGLPSEVDAQQNADGTFPQVVIRVSVTTKIRWIVPPNSPCYSHELTDSIIVTPKAAGLFPIGAVTVDKNGALSPISWTIVNAGKAIPIPTPPTPGPGPAPPNPVSSSLLLLVFDDMLTRTPQAATLLGDKQYWNGVIANGHKFRSIDTKNKDAQAWMPFYTKGGVNPPSLVIVDSTAHPPVFLGTVALPVDKAGVDAVIKKYTGK